MFGHLELNKQRILAEELDRTNTEVLKKLEQLRNKLLWELCATALTPLG